MLNVPSTSILVNMYYVVFIMCSIDTEPNSAYILSISE